MKPISIPIVIQATFRSRVFEGKGTVCLADGTTVLAYLVQRIQSSWRGRIILTTSDEPEDDSLVA